MRAVVIALALLAQLQAARADEVVNVWGLAAPDLRGDALVWEDATFLLEPSEGALKIRLSTFGGGRDQEVGHAIPVRIITSTRSFVEVELSRADGCASRRVELDPRVEGLRLFVKRDDLAPVLVQPYSVTGSDGTAIRLAAGVPVLPEANGLYTVSVRGDRLRLPIPHASVGYVYTSAKVTEPVKPGGPLVRVDPMTVVELDGAPFAVRATWIAPKPTQRGARALLSWSARCIELTVSAPASALRPASWSPPVRSHAPHPPVVKLPNQVPRGTPLTTTWGREVAVAADVIEVGAPIEPAGACFEARLTVHRLDDPAQDPLHRTLKLCASADHVLGGIKPAGSPDDLRGPPLDAKRTPNGVWYRVLVPGRGGPSPGPRDDAVVACSAWTTDGVMFDSSSKRRFPIPVLIPGLRDALQVMTVGMKARFWIPEELGAGWRPAGMRVYDIELLGIGW